MISDIDREMIYNLFVECDLVHNRVTTPAWGFETHQMDQYNLVFVYEGKGIFQRDDEVRAVQRGDLVFFDRGCKRTMTTNPDNLLKLYTVNFQATLPVVTAGEWSLHEVRFPFEFVKRVEDEELFARLTSLFDRMCRVHISPSDSRRARERESFANILDLIMFLYQDGAVSFSDRRKVERVIRYMSEHYAEKLTLKDLAELEQVSVSHLNMIFRRMLNQPPIDYLIHLRMEKAKQFLEDGHRVSDVALSVGFSDIYYFSNAFKKAEGISPTAYVRTLGFEAKGKELQTWDF